MNQVIAGAVGMLVVVCVALWGGYAAGKRDSTVTARVNPLITASCIELKNFAITDRTFGTTTIKYELLGKQYRTLYTAACLAQ